MCLCYLWVTQAPLIVHCRRAELRTLASTIFTDFASSDTEDARIAVKVATLLQLTADDLGGAAHIAHFVLRFIEASRTDAKALQPAVAVLRAYPALLPHLGAASESCAGILADVVANGQRSAAIDVARSLDLPAQVRDLHSSVSTWCALQPGRCRESRGVRVPQAGLYMRRRTLSGSWRSWSSSRRRCSA